MAILGISVLSILPASVTGIVSFLAADSLTIVALKFMGKRVLGKAIQSRNTPQKHETLFYERKKLPD